MKTNNVKKEINKKKHPWQLKHARINRGGVIWKSHRIQWSSNREGFASFEVWLETLHVVGSILENRKTKWQKLSFNYSKTSLQRKQKKN